MARWMAEELGAQRLRVVLVPDEFHPGGVRRLRAVEEQNPGWYRAFCAEFPAQRRRPRRRALPDTAIKRRHVLRGLEELGGGRCRSEYAKRLLPYVRDQADRQIFKQAMDALFEHDPKPLLTLKLLELI